MLALATMASAQTSYTLANLIKKGNSGKTYTITDDLVGVYVSPHYPNVIFAKDEKGYESPSYPSDDQINNNRLYDERDGVLDDWGEWQGTFDQSNWVKIVLPEGTDAGAYRKKIIKKNTLTGMVNVQNNPCNPLGLTLSVEGTLPTAGNSSTYTPNTYCTANFVMQPEWYLVKPQNQEYAMIHWAVWHAADKKFYVPKQAGTVNSAGLKGSFPVDMSLWEMERNVDPTTVFQDGYLYEFPALIEFRLGSTFTLDIDPGFGNDHNIHFAPPRRIHEIGDGGEPPYIEDEDHNRQTYTVLVYPLNIASEVITGVEQVRTGAAVQSVRYVDVQGHVAAEPRPGVNICVTTYSDGTVLTEKVLF